VPCSEIIARALPLAAPGGVSAFPVILREYLRLGAAVAFFLPAAAVFPFLAGAVEGLVTVVVVVEVLELDLLLPHAAIPSTATTRLVSSSFERIEMGSLLWT
jgi:hypothetical protein